MSIGVIRNMGSNASNGIVGFTTSRSANFDSTTTITFSGDERYLLAVISAESNGDTTGCQFIANGATPLFYEKASVYGGTVVFGVFRGEVGSSVQLVCSPTNIRGVYTTLIPNNLKADYPFTVVSKNITTTSAQYYNASASTGTIQTEKKRLYIAMGASMLPGGTGNVTTSTSGSIPATLPNQSYISGIMGARISAFTPIQNEDFSLSITAIGGRGVKDVRAVGAMIGYFE